MKKILFILSLLGITFLQSCDFLFGSLTDDEVEQIFEQGKIDPTLSPQSVGYVPILPVWNFFKNPVDVFVGYDEMVYVVDDNGLNILDLKGELHRTIPIPGATEVTQDRRIHTYVIGEVTRDINGEAVTLTAIFHLKNTATASGPVFVDTLIHPFCDESRRNIPFRKQDKEVKFTGLACRADNVLMVSRTGPVYDPTSSARPDNAILFFDENGNNIGYAKGLSPNIPNLKSVIGVSSIASFAGPPQVVFGMNESHDFIICQKEPSMDIEYRVLWIREIVDPDAGVTYAENSSLLAMDPTKADGFLYEPGKFVSPEDVYIAPDQSGYIFVVDSGTDMFYQFTSDGKEGVEPPPNFPSSKNIKVSFGGEGEGPFSLKEPSGVCYYKKTVYIADKGNNRIIRYRLNTDLE